MADLVAKYADELNLWEDLVAKYAEAVLTRCYIRARVFPEEECGENARRVLAQFESDRRKVHVIALTVVSLKLTPGDVLPTAAEANGPAPPRTTPGSKRKRAGTGASEHYEEQRLGGSLRERI